VPEKESFSKAHSEIKATAESQQEEVILSKDHSGNVHYQVWRALRRANAH